MIQRIAACSVGLLGAVAALVATRRARRIDLRDRVVVVTGGGRGLGLAISREFLARGCKLAICGRDGEVIARAVAELRMHGGDAFGMACDASEPGQVADFIAATLERFGAIDILVNNAGQVFFGPLAELEPDDLESALRNTFWVQYRPTMAVLPHMRARGSGRIVNVTSGAGKLPIPHHGAYVAGKFAATGWSQVLTSELRKDGILVSTITPPPLADGAPLHTHFNGRRDEEFKWFTLGLTTRWMATDPVRAARVVVDAAAHGDRERAVSPMAWLAIRAQGLAPGLMSWLWSRFDRLLPPPGPPGQSSKMQLGADVLAASQDGAVQKLGEAARTDARRFRPSGA